MTTSSSQFLFRMLPPVILVVILAAGGEGQRPDCPGKCGDISITFPFGIGHGCFREGFEVLCNHSRAFLTGNRTYKGDSEGKHEWSYSLLELASISAATSEVRAYAAVSYRCSINENTSSSLSLRMDFSRTPFAVSSKRNVLQGVSWIVDARLTYEPYFSAAADGFPCSVPESNYLDRPAGTNGSCVAAQSCCVAPFPPDDGPNKIISLAVRGSDKNRWWETYPCSYGMLVEESGYTFSTPDIRGNMTLLQRYPKGTPFMLDFAAGNTSCPADGLFLPPDYVCVSGNSSCANATTRTRDFPTRGTTITRGYVCKCWEHYDGNPYIRNGCQDIDECKLLENPCPNGGICKNRLDGYDCPCKFGMKDDGKGGTCTDVFPRAAQAAVGAIGGILLLVITSFLIILYKEKKKMKEFYKNNGGPLLEKATGIKIFKKGTLKPILRNSNIIGKGGFGEVYKGLLDNKEVAIKKPINGSVRENKQFANEVIIQSQVIHKNIVRLIGCCLEVEAPLLVYEFISQGSLHDILHETNNKVALNLDARLSIAAQSADGLAYMHSQANTKILHGDVKPANILLDENLAPKISDFGISRLLAIDKQHTASIIGDVNYMDPVYLQEGLLTEKSDVYSFGVVILELISRRKAIHSDNNSLVKCFLEAHKEQKKATEFFDKEIAIAEDLELLDSLAGMAVQCLSLDVHQRPTMMEVAELLHKLSRSRKVQDVCH